MGERERESRGAVAHTHRQYPSRGARQAESCQATLAPASVGQFRSTMLPASVAA